MVVEVAAAVAVAVEVAVVAVAVADESSEVVMRRRWWLVAYSLAH